MDNDKKFIYADNAATTRIDDRVLGEMLPYLKEEYGNASQPYSFSRKCRKAIKESREIIASYIGANPEEVFFTSGGTESDNWAIKAPLFPLRKDVVCVTSAIEHHAVLNASDSVSVLGVEVLRIPVTDKGEVTDSALNSVVDSGRSGLVSVMYANNEIGTIEPVADLAMLAHSKGYLFHTDAVQAVGHVDIDVRGLGVDYLSASSHKFNGPKGIGFLFVKKGSPISPYIHGGSQERGLRGGTENVAAIVGMARALEINCESIRNDTRHKAHLERMLEARLLELGVRYSKNGAQNHMPGLMSLSFPGESGERLLHRLDLMGIAISTGSACDGRNTEVSHVLSSIGLDERKAKGTIRVSFGRENTSEDAAAIAQALANLIAKD